MFHNKNI